MTIEPEHVGTADQLRAQIALNDSDPENRLRATSVVKDLDVLGQIAQSDDDGAVRLVAVRKVKDQQVLFEIARRDQDSRVRLAAVKRIKDQDLLEQLAIPPRLDVCIAALAKLIDEDHLTSIACDHTLTEADFEDPALNLGLEIRSAALDSLTDEDRVADIAMGIGLHPDDGYRGLRSQAIESLRNLRLLRKIIEESDDDWIVEVAQSQHDEIWNRINR